MTRPVSVDKLPQIFWLKSPSPTLIMEIFIFQSPRELAALFTEGTESLPEIRIACGYQLPMCQKFLMIKTVVVEKTTGIFGEAFCHTCAVLLQEHVNQELAEISRTKISTLRRGHFHH